VNSCSEVCYYDQFISTVIAAASDAGEPC